MISVGLSPGDAPIKTGDRWLSISLYGLDKGAPFVYIGLTIEAEKGEAGLA
jgi:hypothetical protein